MTTLAERRDKVVDALGATAHPLSWVLLVAECVLAVALTLSGVALAARGATWGWTLVAAAAAWLVGVVLGRCRPVLWLPVYSWTRWW